MEQTSKILGIWILDEISRITLVQRTYTENVMDEQLVQTLYSTILSFPFNGLEEKRGGTTLMGERRIIFEKAQNLYFIVAIEEDYDILDAKRILSHLRVTFLRKYPIRDYSWQSDKNNRHFKEFVNTIDEIVHHFGDTKIVVKIVLMGLDYAGKTTLAHAFANSKYHNYFPTKGLDILKIEYKNMLLRIWDLGGQRQFWKLWPKFAAEASGIIFVVDSTADRWTETLEAFEVSKLLNLPCVIFANKQDIIGEVKDINYIAERLDVPLDTIVGGSALLNEGVPKLLDRLIEDIQAADLEEEVKEDDKAEELVSINQIHEQGLRFLQDLETKEWIGLNPILMKVRRLLGFENMIILKSTEGTGDFQIITCDGEDCKLLKEKFSINSSQAILHKVLTQKEPIIIPEIANEYHELFIEGLKNKLLSAIIIPIFDTDRNWGVYLTYSDKKGYPDQKHADMFLIFSQYLAMGFKYLLHKN